MEVVAQHLKGHATALSAGVDRDLFGRSAFNRFYYATFLTVKADLMTAIPDLPRDHAGIPNFLRTTVKNQLAKGAGKARRADDSALVSICSRAKSAAFELADLLEEGYTTRVVADYNPDIPVSFDGRSNFALNNISVEHAQTWPHRARAFTRSIVNAWRQISV